MQAMQKGNVEIGGKKPSRIRQTKYPQRDSESMERAIYIRTEWGYIEDVVPAMHSMLPLKTLQFFPHGRPRRFGLGERTVSSSTYPWKPTSLGVTVGTYPGCIQEGL